VSLPDVTFLTCEECDMELLFLAAFSILVAMGFNFFTPKFAATSFGQKFVGSYFRVTLGTALVIFLAIYVSAVALSFLSVRPTLPSTSNLVP
jgi:hypothetical protein